MSARRRRLLLRGSKLDLEWPLHNLPDLQAWYTFDDADYLYQDTGATTPVASNSDEIKYCTDRSGSGRHLVDTALTGNPSWLLNTLHGRATARFNAVAMLHNAAPGALLRNASGATVIMVLRTDAPGAVNYPLCICKPGTNNSARLFIIRELSAAGSLGIGGRREDGDSYETYETAGGVFAADEWGVQAVRIDYSSSDAWIYYQNEQVGYDSSWVDDGVTSDTDAGEFGVGGVPDSTNEINGYIGEVIICGSDIGRGLLSGLHTEYLWRKWGHM